MSYYDPFYPSLEATRLQIQRSFLALQQKLRLQRELDLELNYENSIRAQPMKLALYEDELRYREGLASSQYLRANVYDREIADRLKFAHEEEANNLRHLSKIERLQKQRLKLSRERAISGVDRKLDYYQTGARQKYASDQYHYDDDQRLLRKYEDGTRARQLTQDIIKNRGKYNTASKNQKDRNQDLNRTPYSGLQYGSGTKQFSNQKLSYLNNLKNQNQKGQDNYRRENKNKYQGQRQSQEQEDGHEPKFGQANYGKSDNQNQGRNERDGKERSGGRDGRDGRGGREGREGGEPSSLNKNGSQSRDLQSINKVSDQTFGFKSEKQNKLSSRGRNRSRSQKQLNYSNNKHANLSPYKSFLEPGTDRSPIKFKTSATKRQYEDRSRSRIAGTAQQRAMQKIKNRLKCSANIYKDSQFHNIKHELSHLFNTYDCEYRLRKELKMKINNHPFVLKKHAMVVQ